MGNRRDVGSRQLSHQPACGRTLFTSWALLRRQGLCATSGVIISARTGGETRRAQLRVDRNKASRNDRQHDVRGQRRRAINALRRLGEILRGSLVNAAHETLGIAVDQREPRRLHQESWLAPRTELARTVSNKKPRNHTTRRGVCCSMPLFVGDRAA